MTLNTTTIAPGMDCDREAQISHDGESQVARTVLILKACQLLEVHKAWTLDGISSLEQKLILTF